MMNVTFDRDKLMNAVQPAMSAVSTKNTAAAIDCIRITAKEDGTVFLNSFDMDKGVVVKTEGEVDIAGSYCINGQKLSQIIRNMPGQVTINVNEKAQAVITSGHSRFTVNALPGDEFPNTPMLEGDWGFEISEWELKDMLQKTVYAVANNDPRPALNGVYFHIENNKMTTVASDSYRLAIAEKEIDIKSTSEDGRDLDQEVIVPAKTLQELMKMIGDSDFKVKILCTRKHIIFFKGNLSYFSRLIDANYIEYKKFMPKNVKYEVILDREELLQGMERASLVTEDKSLGQSKSYVRCCFENEMLTISSISTNTSIMDEIPFENECEKLEIGFNCRYLLEALRAADTQKIKISLVSQLVSILIDPVEEEEAEEDAASKAKFTFLVVPIRMKE